MTAVRRQREPRDRRGLGMTMPSTRPIIDPRWLVLPFCGLAFSCSMQSSNGSGPAGAYERRLQDVDEKLGAIRPILGGYPPKISSDAQLAEVKLQWTNTEDELKNMRETYPNSADVELRLGEVYRFGHNLDIPESGQLCVAHLERAISLQPDLIAAHLELGIFYTDAGIRWAPLGERSLRRAIQLSGATPLPRAWRALTLAYYYQGKFPDAVAAADEYLSLVPDDERFRQLRQLAKSAGSRGAIGLEERGGLPPSGLQPGDVQKQPEPDPL